MPDLSTKVRTVEPFGYWPNYASAFAGLGGEQGAPDPYYCFHTPYLQYEPGGLIFRMRLVGARATTGELALRVHAWKADGSMDAVLAGGIRVALEDLTGDAEYAVRVVSVPGVIYALFARFTQPSDLRIDDLILTAEELGDEDAETYTTADVASSAFCAVDLHAPSHLTLLGEPSLRVPLSQPFTTAQLADRELFETLPEALRTGADTFARWRAAYAWQVLEVYGMMQPGAVGWVAEELGAKFRELLGAKGSLVSEGGLPEGRAFLDYLVDVANVRDSDLGPQLPEYVLRRMTAVKRGGLGVFLFDAQLGGLAAASVGEGEGPRLPGEQEVQRLALKVIGHGSDVAQLAWPHVRDGLQVAPFGMIVRR